MSLVLTPLSITELKTFFDDDALRVIQYFIKKAIISQPEKLSGQNDLPIQIPKEHIEQWLVQALGAQPLGAGSYPIDVKKDDWGADVKMLSCRLDEYGNLTSADSGETSLAQKFSDDNFGDSNTLDTLFSQQKHQYIWTKWKEILIAKYKKVETDFAITNIYYFFVLRAGTVFYLCGLKVNLEHLEDTSINATRSTANSIWINNFIDNDFGHIKIYKAKKRLELRLKPKKWLESDMLISFDTDFEQIGTNIRDKIIEDKLNDYIDKVLIPIIQPQRLEEDE